MLTFVAFVCILLSHVQCMSLDVFGSIIEYATDDELFYWYFGNSSFKLFRNLITKQFIKRNNKLTLTLHELKKLKNSFSINNLTHNEEFINQQIERLQSIQQQIDSNRDQVNFPNRDYFRNQDLRGIKFSDSTSILNLANNHIVTLYGIHFGANIKRLDLRNNAVTNLNGISFPESLIELVLNGNPIEGHLNDNNIPSTLEILRISYCEKITSISIPPTLKSLSIIDSGISSPHQLIMPNVSNLSYITMNPELHAMPKWTQFKLLHNQIRILTIDRH